MEGPTFKEVESPEAAPRLSGPVSTNSMVTIRLSNSPVTPATNSTIDFPQIEPSLEENNDQITEQKSINTSESQVAPEVAGQNNEHSDTLLAEEVKLFQRSHRMSTVSMPSIEEEKEEEGSNQNSKSLRSRSDSSSTRSSAVSAFVDWEELDKTEESVPRDEGSDESIAFLLARLEQENNALATDPKAAMSRSTRGRAKSRPPSIQQLKKLVNEPTKPSLRYSALPEPPPLTELEFWAALVTNYSQTAQRLPTLTSSKIRNGVPPPLRGVVWISITGARDQLLEERYEKLCNETSPYENLIGKDIGRSFPNVEMFKDPSGEGQQMLAKVLKCFSLYDQKIGYCQGLGFVVGPLLMHMGDKEAFCVLVHLMEHYDLRSCFLPDLSGLHLRIYQFQHLLKQHLPNLMAYLEGLQVEPLYVSQWFLSFFAVTCPLPMLLRIYDVILTEGASETLMRVALSLMRRNERKIKSCQEFEDVMHLLLSRELWDTYGCNADDLVNDFVGLTGLVTRERLEQLEKTFSDSPNVGATAIESPTLGIQAAASSFLGRFWAGSNTSTKSTSPTSSLGVMAPPRPSSFLRRSPSKQSVASTLDSVDTTESYLSTTSTEATAMSRNPSADCTQIKLSQPQYCTNISPTGARKDKDLHGQIEDLLTALGDMQRQQNLLANELQQVREEREEDHAVVQTFIRQTMRPTLSIPLSSRRLQLQDDGHVHTGSGTENPASIEEDGALTALENHFNLTPTKRSSILQTKSELRDDLRLWKDQYEIEASRSADLLRQLSDQEAENARILENNRDLERRVLDAQKDKENLEKTIEGLRSRRQSVTDSFADSSPLQSPDANSPTQGGVDGYRHGRAGSTPALSAPAPTFSKRSSSLGIQAVLATEDHRPLPDEALLLELVNAKTSEALARQELEEVKGKLDSFRKMLGGTGPSPTVNGHRSTPSEPCFSKGSSASRTTAEGGPLSVAGKDGLKVVTSATTPGGGFFSGWGKRTVSTPVISSESPKSGVSSNHLPLAR